MKRSAWVLTFVFLVALLALSQTATSDRTAASGVVGAVDPFTGTFTPMRGTVVPGHGFATTAAATYGGKLAFTFSISVKSVVPAADKISCRASAIVVDTSISPGVLTAVQESAAAVATRSGSTATCTLTIPYSWTLNNGPTDQMSLSYGLSFAPGTTALPLLSRTSGQGLGNFAIPANGTTTNLAVSATI